MLSVRLRMTTAENLVGGWSWTSDMPETGGDEGAAEADDEHDEGGGEQAQGGDSGIRHWWAPASRGRPSTSPSFQYWRTPSP